MSIDLDQMQRRVEQEVWVLGSAQVASCVLFQHKLRHKQTQRTSRVRRCEHSSSSPSRRNARASSIIYARVCGRVPGFRLVSVIRVNCSANGTVAPNPGPSPPTCSGSRSSEPQPHPPNSDNQIRAARCANFCAIADSH